MNLSRSLSLISESIQKIGLNLSGLNVLTEAATGYYSLTPIIALLAGAKKVYALSGDSPYGTKEQAVEQVSLIAKKIDASERILFLASRKDEQISNADIITNLGFVRPINNEIILRLKSTSAISLMFETWEYRSEDIDLETCKQQNIPVLGTNEKTKDVNIFNYIGPLAVKLALELDIECTKSRVVVIGDDIFGSEILTTFKKFDAETTIIHPSNGIPIGSEKYRGVLSKADLIVIADMTNHELLLGPNGQISAHKLKEINPGVSIVHIAGGVDQEELDCVRLPYKPGYLKAPGYMSCTTAYLGPRPLIELHTAGLKVGEALAKARLNGLDYDASKKYAIANSPAQDFR
jgi:hypothetical protein